MKEIKTITQQALTNLNKQQPEQQSTSNHFEKAFVRLWTILTVHFQHQGFLKKMGECNSTVAKAWRDEFHKADVGYDEIVIIGQNLSVMDNPQFIPNVFQLIGIVEKIQADPELKIAHERVSTGLPYLPSDKEIMAQRERTAGIRMNEMNKIREMI